MILAIRKRLEGKDEGFTLIELLVVVIIIGILAAIAIPTFLRQRERGWEADAQSVLRNAAVAAESYATQNNGVYTGMTRGELEAEGLNVSTDVNFPAPQLQDVDGVTNGGYIMTANHTAGGSTFRLDSTVGQIVEVP